MDQSSRDPLHLWSKTVFQEIGEICGGWVATEEETKLKNHMKWARIQVANDGSKIPKEVAVLWNDIKFYFQIWPECSPRFETMLENDKGKDDTSYPVQRFNQRVLGERICDVDSESHQLRDFPTLQHVAPANKVTMSAREGHVSHLNEGYVSHLKEISKECYKSGPNNSQAWCIGPDVAAQVIVNNYQGEIEGLLTTQRSFDCVEEIRAQRVLLGENSPTFSRIVGKSVEIMGIERLRGG
uniref:Putative ovule protein n=1 Tax=Solanum chacoense TaxID=4108 RepID=A0A0V0IPF3_SOLCH